VAGGSGSGALQRWEGEEMVRHVGLEVGVAGERSSPWGTKEGHGVPGQHPFNGHDGE
jgi:hypothetical protein